MITLNFISKKYVLLSLLLSITLMIKAQVPNFGVSNDINGYTFNPSIGLSTPQVSDFIKYGNPDVNHYNGLLDLEIPLDGYKDKDFELPMSLKYISSGFMPGKRPSIVGYNWLFNFGGVITRNVKGSPDDVKGNPTRSTLDYMKPGLLAAIRSGSFSGCTADYLTNFRMPINQVSGYNRNDVYHDFEPDVFHFAFGKHSGSFIIGNNAAPISLSGDGYKIDLSGVAIQEYSATAIPQTSSIKITTPDGYVYQFGGDNTYLEYFFPNNPSVIAKRPRHITAWYLKSIKAPNSREVTFQYESKLLPNHYNYFLCSQIHSYTPGFSNRVQQMNEVIKESTWSPVLKKVQIDNVAKIEFEYVYGRGMIPDFYQWGDNLTYLTNVSYYYNSEKVRETTLDYINKGCYVFLEQLKKNSDIYAFGYDLSFTPPSPLTMSLDHWGFWNGKNIKVPSDVTWYCLYQIYPDKNTALSYHNTGMLTSILYPTGGSTSVKYEINNYTKYQQYNMQQQGLLMVYPSGGYIRYCGGARVKEIADYDPQNNKASNIRIFEYKSPQSPYESGVIGVYPNYQTVEKWVNQDDDSYYKTQTDVSCNSIGRNENLSEYHVGYSDVTERLTDGSYIHYHYSSNLDIPNTTDGNTHSEMYRNAFVASGVTGLSIASDMEIWEKGDLYKTNDLAHFRGKLLEKTCYDKSGVRKQTEKYTYNTSDAQSRYNISVASLPRGMCAYKIFLTPCMLKKKEVIDSNNHTQTEYYSYNTMNMVSEKKTVNSDESTHSVQYRYPSDYSYISLSTGERKLMDMNMIDKPMKIFKTVQNASYPTPMIQKAVVFDYKTVNNIPVVDKVKELKYPTPVTENSSEFLNNLVVKEVYEDYDSYGNPTCVVQNDSIKSVYIWGYNRQHLIAEIKNATSSDVSMAIDRYNGTGILQAITGKAAPLESDWNYIMRLQSSARLKNAHVTIYKHKPLIGISEIIDPMGISTYYDYDSFGRTKEIYIKKDSQKQILESFDYHYSNQ